MQERFTQYNLTIEGQLEPTFARDFLSALDWCAKNPRCEGNLGLPRSKMPQFGFGVVEDFMKWLDHEKGVASKLTVMSATDLRATQREINAKKVQRYADRPGPISMDPIPVSREGYILDGHHRWAATLTRSLRSRVKVYKIDLPIRPLLKAAHEFPGTFQVDLMDAPVDPTRVRLGAYHYDRRR